jgi:hypothetical protein
MEYEQLDEKIRRCVCRKTYEKMGENSRKAYIGGVRKVLKLDEPKLKMTLEEKFTEMGEYRREHGRPWYKDMRTESWLTRD